MRITAWIIALTCLAITPAWAQDCTLKKLADLPLTVQSDNIFIPIRIGDQTEQFELGIASSLGGLSEDFAKAHGFKPIRIDDGVTVRIGGTEIKNQVVVPESAIGDIPIKDMHLLLLPADMPAKGTVGYFSVSRFAKLDFELDLDHKSLRLFLPNHCPGQVVYWAPADKATAMPYLKSELTSSIRSDMKLDGKDVRVSFNLTGISMMSMDAAHDIFGLNTDSPGMVATTPPPGLSSKTDQKYYSYPFKSLTVGGISIINPNIVIYDAPNVCGRYHKDRNDAQVAGRSSSTLFPVKDATCNDAYDIIIGNSVLAKLRLYFSTKDNLIYATAADAQN